MIKYSFASPKFGKNNFTFSHLIFRPLTLACQGQPGFANENEAQKLIEHEQQKLVEAVPDAVTVDRDSSISDSYTHHELVFGFQNPISPELYIFLNHKILDLALLSLWFCSIEKSKFQANSCPETPKTTS